jgi:hypothetical protein
MDASSGAIQSIAIQLAEMKLLPAPAMRLGGTAAFGATLSTAD